MAKFSDRVFGANVDKKVIEEFQKLAGGGGVKGFKKGSQGEILVDENFNPLEAINPTFEKYLGDRTAFARMWTATLISGSTRQEIVYNIVNDNRDESYVEINEPIGDVINKELTDNPHLKPKAGITSITSKTEGALGAIKSTDVSFVVHNKRDFEDIFLPYFLKPGSTVVVDYGWSDKSFNPYDVSKTISNTDLELSAFKDNIYGGVDKKPNGFINDNIGLVDTLIGKVTDYNISVNQQGSFECSVTLTSENTSLLDAEITEDNNLKFIFANKIEEIIIKTLSSKSIGNMELSYYDALSAGDKQVVRENFYNNFKLSGTTTGTIPPSAIKSGLFYQDVTDTAGGKQNDKDVLYINYGLFEDLFLNTLIAENRITNSPHRVNYNTKDTFVRYEANLVERQKQILNSSEALSLFLYPDDWTDSYNKTTGKEFKLHKSKVNEYKTQIIPLRELFISVALISKTFAQKQNVNDALVSIYEAINEDSYGVFKLMMISLNKSYSSLSVQDVNLIPELPEKINMLKFDVTSDKSIVSGLDYKFGMPKGGMSSMIAIGEKGDFDVFDEKQSDNLNFLRILGPNKDKFGENAHFKSLPIVKSKEDKPDKSQKTAYDFAQHKTKAIVDQMDLIPVKKDIRQSWVEVVQHLSKKKQEKDQAAGISSTINKNHIFGQVDETLLPSNSLRDYYGKMANINVVLNNKATSVSSILPIELTLTIYGNTYLQVGDIFNINFLPDFYQDNIMFQILNIEQKVSSNWETTYSTVMRLRPKKKGHVTNTDLKKPILSETYTHNLIGNGNSHLNHGLGNGMPVIIAEGVATKVEEAYSKTKTTPKPLNKTQIKNFQGYVRYRLDLDILGTGGPWNDGVDGIWGKNTISAWNIHKVNYDPNVDYSKPASPVVEPPPVSTRLFDCLTSFKAPKRYTEVIRKHTAEIDDLDSRLIKIEFQKPKTLQDIAFIFAFQKTIYEYINTGTFAEKATLVHVKKEGKTTLDINPGTDPFDKNDILITALVEDKGLLGVDNVIIDYFNEVKFRKEQDDEKMRKSLLEKMAKSEKLKLMYDIYFGDGYIPRKIESGNASYAVKTKGKKVKGKNVDTKYGFVMSSIGFMISTDNDVPMYYGEGDSKTNKNIFIIKMSGVPGITIDITDFELPAWFLKSGATNFCKQLDLNYYSTVDEIAEFFQYAKADADVQQRRDQAMDSMLGAF